VQPWLYTTFSDRVQFYSVQHQVGEVMRIAALFAQPFMPVKAAEMLDILGVRPQHRTIHFATWGADQHYGRPRVQGQPPIHIFPKLEELEAVRNETMEETMKRRRAEKLALREKRRRNRPASKMELEPETEESRVAQI
jgi:methionyl-tRNA synthetase